MQFPSIKKRIPPLSQKDLTAAETELLQQVTSINPPPNLLMTLLYSAEAYKKMLPFGAYISTGSKLSELHREVAILRTAWRIGAEYEWQHHFEKAEAAGLDTSLVHSLASHDFSSLAPDLIVVVNTVDELIDDHGVSDGTWQRLIATYSPAELVDLILTVGLYQSIGMVIASFGVQLDH